MSIEAAETAKRWFEEVWNQRRIATIDELLSDESVCYGEGEPIRGRDGFIARLFSPFVSAFPNLKVTIDDTLVENQQAVVRWSAIATHTGQGVGIEPTGKTLEFHGLTWLRIVDGKLAEGWQYSNIAENLRSLSEH